MAEHEAEQIERAKESGRTPVVFVHGLWLLPSSWDRWAAFFEEDDFVALTPGWPDDPLTVEEAKAIRRCSRASRSARSPPTTSRSSRELDPHAGDHRPFVRRAHRPDPGWARSRRPPPWRSIRHRSGARRRCRSPRCAPPALPLATRPTATRRSRSPTTSSVIRSPTRSTRTRPRPCTRSSRCRRPPSRYSRPPWPI